MVVNGVILASDAHPVTWDEVDEVVVFTARAVQRTARPPSRRRSHAMAASVIAIPPFKPVVTGTMALMLACPALRCDHARPGPCRLPHGDYVPAARAGLARVRGVPLVEAHDAAGDGECSACRWRGDDHPLEQPRPRR